MCEILDDYTTKLKQFGAVQEKINRLENIKCNEDIIAHEIKRLEAEKTQILMLLASIDSAIEQLDEESIYLIKERYVKETPWEDLVENYNKEFRKKPSIGKRAMQKKIIKSTYKLKEYMQPLEPAS
jgi:hypothetical protein